MHDVESESYDKLQKVCREVRLHVFHFFWWQIAGIFIHSKKAGGVFLKTKKVHVSSKVTHFPDIFDKNRTFLTIETFR